MTTDDPSDDPSDDPDRRLFHAALKHPPGPVRDAWLAGACGGDATLEQRVRALLFAHEEETQVSPEKGHPHRNRSEERAGTQIGDYKLREQIGEGGFGTVWVADQERPVRRRVALKIVKLGMDTRDVIARFEQERQALAMMDHPNIARVFDAGATEQGRPYFVMELVRGVKITDYCDEQKLSTAQRLGLFITVCQAVQHAHQKGIIHRDLKPSNILVTTNDGAAVPKVIDFGVAKATLGRLSENTIYTQFQQMIGTPLYMSPEQAELTSLDIDTRSDIYSLGVLLYELLTGHTPIDQGTVARIGLDELRRIIREVDPPRPSMRIKTLPGAELTQAAKRRHTDTAKLPGTLRGDIDWIVMKCLEKDRKRRYETAAGLALDLQRHLRNEMVTARSPTSGYLLSKLIRRNRVAFAAGAAIAASLVVGLTVSVWQGLRAQREALRATTVLDELRATAPAFAEQARALVAKERFDEAIEKLDYAVKLRPDAPEFLIAKADLLQCQLRFAEAAVVYRAALRLAPDDARVRSNAELSDRLQAEQAGPQGLSRESLVQFLVAMASERRSAVEMLQVGRLVGEEQKLVLGAWLERLKDMPVPPAEPLEERLMMSTDGMLMLDLSDTFVADLGPLEGMPLASLDLRGCPQVADLRPLSLLPLKSLNLGSTTVSDLTPLAQIRTLTGLGLDQLPLRDLSALQGLPLTDLSANGTEVADLAPLRGMPLKALSLRNTPVSDLSSLAGMPLVGFDGTSIPATDFSPLAGAPLEMATFQSSRIGDLGFLRGMPVKTLALNGCEKARGFAVLQGLASLETLVLPANVLSLPKEEMAAIAALRAHPALRQIELGLAMNIASFVTTQSSAEFWTRWDEGMRSVLALHEAGVTFTASELADGGLKFVINDPAFRDLTVFEGCKVRELVLDGTAVTDLAPLASLPLKVLSLDNTPVVDLAALAGIPLEELWLRETPVRDLSPLSRTPLCSTLKGLWLYRTKVDDFSPIAACTALEIFDATETSLPDLEPLRGRKLREIYFGYSSVRDISILAGMPLERAFFDGCSILDVGPLLQCPTLKDLIVPKSARNAEALLQLPQIARISYTYDSRMMGPSMTAAQFAEAVTPTTIVAVLLQPDAEWKWLHPIDGRDPAEADPDFHTTFFGLDFDDTAWPTGQDSPGPTGGFGYGDEPFRGVPIGEPEGKAFGHTAYFRCRFTTDKPHSRLELRCQRDDGIVVYLDGHEVARDNMRDGPEAYLLASARTIGEAEETTTCRVAIPGLLGPGPHLLAISLHNTVQPSSDLRIGEITLVEIGAAPWSNP